MTDMTRLCACLTDRHLLRSTQTVLQTLRLAQTVRLYEWLFEGLDSEVPPKLGSKPQK
jgi:hypothetical protein